MTDLVPSDTGGKPSFLRGLRDILGSKPTPGDVATVLIAGPIGLVMDGFITIHGIPSPGVAGTMTASVALGAKKALWPARQSRAKVVRAAFRYAVVLESLLDDDELRAAEAEKVKAMVRRLRAEANACQTKAISAAALKETTEETVRSMRALKFMRG